MGDPARTQVLRRGVVLATRQISVAEVPSWVRGMSAKSKFSMRQTEVPSGEYSKRTSSSAIG